MGLVGNQPMRHSLSFLFPVVGRGEQPRERQLLLTCTSIVADPQRPRKGNREPRRDPDF
jgi:hypothetical protein